MVSTDPEIAANHLRSGKVVAIPTETVYGLAANALDENAVLQIFKIKDRPHFDPLIIHVGKVEDVNKYAQNIPADAIKLMKHFWPGPLTIVLEKKDVIPDVVTSGLKSVAIRMPVHELLKKLLSKIDFPLAAPSANPFGYISPTTAQHVEEQLGEKVQYILDGGPCTVGVESTIISFVDDQPTILRFGGTPVEEIEKVIGPVIERTSGTDNPQAPGQLSSHYASSTPLLYTKDIEGMVKSLSGLKLVILTHSKNDESYGVETMALSDSGKLDEIAINLFRVMREADKGNYDRILVKPVKNQGIGKAINDRLRRASQPGYTD